MSEAKTVTGASLPHISSLLIAARQERKVTIEQASQATKIKLEYLQKLEKGDFTFLPPPYVYAMLKQYASALQIDPETVKKCRTDLGILTDEALNAIVTAQAPEPKLSFDNPEHKKWGIIAGASLGAILLIVLIVQLFSGPSETEVVVKKAADVEPVTVATPKESLTATSETPQAKPDSGKSTASLPVTPPPPPAPAPSAPIPVAPPVISTTQAVKPIATAPVTENKPDPAAQPGVPQVKKILIKTKNDTSWVKVASVDGGFVRESMVPPNQSRAYETKMGFTVIIGKAEAVEVFVDGKMVPLPKSKGRVSLKVGN